MQLNSLTATPSWTQQEVAWLYPHYTKEMRGPIKICRDGGATLRGCPWDGSQSIVLYFMLLLALLSTFVNPKKGLQFLLIHSLHMPYHLFEGKGCVCGFQVLGSPFRAQDQ